MGREMLDYDAICHRVKVDLWTKVDAKEVGFSRGKSAVYVDFTMNGKRFEQSLPSPPCEASRLDDRMAAMIAYLRKVKSRGAVGEAEPVLDLKPTPVPPLSDIPEDVVTGDSTPDPEPSTGLAPIGLHMIDDEPRVLDTDLAERLGMARARDVRQLIDRNIEELRTYGGCGAVTLRISGNSVKAYYLNEEQALLVCMLSKTEKAKDVRREVIRVFVAYRRQRMDGHPDPAALADTQYAVTTIRDAIKADLAEHEKRANKTFYGALQTKVADVLHGIRVAVFDRFDTEHRWHAGQYKQLAKDIDEASKYRDRETYGELLRNRKAIEAVGERLASRPFHGDTESMLQMVRDRAGIPAPDASAVRRLVSPAKLHWSRLRAYHGLNLASRNGSPIMFDPEPFADWWATKGADLYADFTRVNIPDLFLVPKKAKEGAE